MASSGGTFLSMIQELLELDGPVALGEVASR
jgi:hypothetical protein